jgi:hypothetical protein
MLTKIEIYKFILEWFDALDNHKPINMLTEKLDENGFEIKFPDTTIQNLEELQNWYKSVKKDFYDEIHIIKNIDIEITEKQAEVILTLNWEARSRDIQEAYSKNMNCDIIQSWIMTENKENKPVIKQYTLNYIKEKKIIL